MRREIRARPLTADAFAPFGDVLAAEGPPDRLINRGRCGRWHDRARLDFGRGGRPGISLFRSDCVALPCRLDMLERHPDGSQAFIPMTADPFLVIVAPDAQGAPGEPLAFVTDGRQGVNYLRGTWHGVLAPLSGPGLFAVIDRIGQTPNLEEHPLSSPWIVTA